MQENIITWNVANWITVVLMASIGFFLVASITAAARGKFSPSVTQ